MEIARENLFTNPDLPLRQRPMRHVPVMVEAVVKYLVTDSSGIYVDGTFGDGGHARALLRRLGPSARLIAFDWDAEVQKALPTYHSDLLEDERFTFVGGSYATMATHIPAGKAAGVLLDLGVSSMHLDTPERGFSYRYEGPLDMRMNPAHPTAHETIRILSQEELAGILRNYGDVPHAHRLAHNLKKALPQTTQQLVEVIRYMYGHKAAAYMARIFQALRIAVNDELSQLEKGLRAAHTVLQVGGRLAVLTYHSGEDRCIKAFLRTQKLLDPLRGQYGAYWRYIVSPMSPSCEEVHQNPRARSAKLHIAEKLCDGPLSV
ncbi:MAG: 16S rRNA (cytosine(1402)-N(4))-methyltransferase RsmH [Bacteroidia bacterium]